MASTTQDDFAVLHLALEERFQSHTDQLITLTESILNVRGEDGGLDRDTAAAMTAASRLALAEVVEALRRMAEGSYGTCEGCRADIPVERLAVLVGSESRRSY